MNLLLKIILPVLVLIGSVFAAKKIVDSKPPAGRRGAPPSIQSVEDTTLKLGSFPVLLESQGTVEPSNSTTLVTEVAGSVVRISENLVPGGRFNKGDVLVELDKRDFEITLTTANADLAQAQALLQQEQAQAEVSAREWQSLRGNAQASALTLRKPQVAAARASVRSASAQVQRAQLDLDRAVMVAPYDGIVLESDVDQGQFVNRGTAVGRIYSLAAVDVRLPLSNRQLDWLDVHDPKATEKPKVLLSASIGTTEYQWEGQIERVEGFDAGNQQLNVIARVDSPETTSGRPLRVGQFVNAEIEASTLDNVFVIPREALGANDEVFLVNEGSEIIRQTVDVAWGNAEFVAVTKGLEVGSVLVTTPLATVVDGTPVRAIIDGVAPPPAARGGQGEGRGQQQEGNRGQGNRQGGGQNQGSAEGSAKPQGESRGDDGGDKSNSDRT